MSFSGLFLRWIIKNVIKNVAYILALSPADKLKARRRNLVSAKVGFYSFIFMFIYEPIIILLYTLPLEVGK